MATADDDTLPSRAELAEIVEQQGDKIQELESRLEQSQPGNVVDQVTSGPVSRRTFLTAALGTVGLGALTGRASAAPSWSNDQGLVGTLSRPQTAVYSVLGYFQENRAEFVNIDDTSQDPQQNGIFRRDGSEVKVATDGVVKSLTDIGTASGTNIWGDSGTNTPSGGDIYVLPNSDDGININYTATDSLWITEGGTAKQALIDRPASGSVQLSSGSATVDTGVSATGSTFVLAIGSGDSVKAAGRIDTTGSNVAVELVEDGTSVGNPTIDYDVLRVR